MFARKKLVNNTYYIFSAEGFTDEDAALSYKVNKQSECYLGKLRCVNRGVLSGQLHRGGYLSAAPAWSERLLHPSVAFSVFVRAMCIGAAAASPSPTVALLSTAAASGQI